MTVQESHIEAQPHKGTSVGVSGLTNHTDVIYSTHTHIQLETEKTKTKMLNSSPFSFFLNCININKERSRRRKKRELKKRCRGKKCSIVIQSMI